jgi:hypothetical protein
VSFAGRRRAAGVALIVACLAAPAGARAASGGAGVPSAGPARLTGHFAMSGRVTAATHIRGEHPGQLVHREWTFTPLCPSGPCPAVQLVRVRARGSDTTVLTATGPGTYVGHGRFDAPLRCAGRTRPKGESVPFTIRLTITATATVLGAQVASQIHATYVNRRRTNLTRCVDIPGHDAAVYDGLLGG